MKLDNEAANSVGLLGQSSEIIYEDLDELKKYKF